MIRKLLLLVLLVPLVTACDNGEPSKSATPGSTGKSATSKPGASGDKAAAKSGASGEKAAAKPAGDVKEEPGLKLVKPGAEPRVALRYEPKVGAKETFLISQSISQAEVGSKPRNAPSSRIKVEMTFKDKVSDKAFNYDLAVIDASIIPEPGAPAAMVQALTAAVESLKGVKGTMVVTDHGRATGVKMLPSKTMSAQHRPLADQLGENWRQMPFVLPNAPVGIGALWQHTTKVKQAGTTVEQTIRYELMGLEGKVAKLKLDIAQKAEPQEVEPAPGLKMKLERFEAKGTGEATLDLTRMAPTASKTELKGDMAMSAPGKPRKDITMVVGVTVTAE